MGSYRQYGTSIDNQGPLQTIKDPYRQEALLTLCNSYRQGDHAHNGHLQTRVPYRPGAPTHKRPLQTLCNFYRQEALHDIQARPQGTHRQGAPTEQGALTDAVQFLQRRGPYKQGTLYDIQARGPYWQRTPYKQRAITITVIPDLKKIISFLKH